MFDKFLVIVLEVFIGAMDLKVNNNFGYFWIGLAVFNLILLSINLWKELNDLETPKYIYIEDKRYYSIDNGKTYELDITQESEETEEERKLMKEHYLRKNKIVLR